MDVVTATGEHLGRIPFNTPGVALKSLQNALDKFAALPEDRRRGNVPKEQSAIPGPPPGTLILRIYLRQLGRNPDGTLRYTEPGDYTDKPRCEIAPCVGNLSMTTCGLQKKSGKL